MTKTHHYSLRMMKNILSHVYLKRRQSKNRCTENVLQASALPLVGPRQFSPAACHRGDMPEAGCALGHVRRPGAASAQCGWPAFQLCIIVVEYT